MFEGDRVGSNDGGKLVAGLSVGRMVSIALGAVDNTGVGDGARVGTNAGAVLK